MSAWVVLVSEGFKVHRICQTLGGRLATNNIVSNQHHGCTTSADPIVSVSPRDYAYSTHTFLGQWSTQTSSDQPVHSILWRNKRERLFVVLDLCPA